ncbi:helix-turn-helix transcriptional regulator [[Flexibacter] sp. ATCC 35208]|uniref:helix-turn-helix transcriptional regulator n=1 Tax=[Flexibacter] sp. ATCC 35208 TaxID=1936242 RepID=UPI0009C8EF9D|nr:helix-turn-helix transcriptional regulator [[Flexibacter] sp. ATCC 35208]OMP77391.1 AraC family transcriptional regulator [[Flexibacter] sp. ATCC 35208]
MQYQTYLAGIDLDPMIQCYWTLEGPAGSFPQKQTIVPDGCMEMIFHYGDLYQQYLEDGNIILQPRCFVIGQLTRPLEIVATGKTGIFSVRFHPDGFSPFTHLPLSEMENSAIPLERLFGNDGKNVELAILNAPGVSERIKEVEQFLTNRLATAETIDHITRSLIEAIWHSNGQLSVTALSRQSQIKSRRLERRFLSDVGMSPKQLSRVIRLNNIFKKLISGKETSLTALAYEGNYFDQSHFIKEFKQLTGYTPKQYYNDNLKMSALLYGKG